MKKINESYKLFGIGNISNFLILLKLQQLYEDVEKLTSDDSK